MTLDLFFPPYAHPLSQNSIRKQKHLEKHTSKFDDDFFSMMQGVTHDCQGLSSLNS